MPSFEVASVKLLSTRSSFSFATTPTGVTAHGVPLGYCVRWAYGLRLYQRHQMAGPDWMEPGGEWVQYDIEARTPSPVDTAGLRLMMRTLLAERWKLAAHRETKVMPVYVLSISKGGPKLLKSETEGAMTVMQHGTSADYRHCTIENLAEIMEAQIGALLIDETELKGQYDFALDFMKYSDAAIPIPGTRTADFGPAYDLALRNIGLKLEMQKRPVEILVVDHIERTPTAN